MRISYNDITLLLFRVMVNFSPIYIFIHTHAHAQIHIFLLNINRINEIVLQSNSNEFENIDFIISYLPFMTERM